MSFLTNTNNQEALAFILISFIVITIIVFFRQIVGIRSFDISTNLITSFAFAFLGLIYALPIFILTFISAALIKIFLITKIRVLYYPRVAMVLIAAVLISSLSFFSAIRPKEDSLLLFLILFFWLIILTEKISAVLLQKNERLTFKLLLGTLLVALTCYPLFNSIWLKQIVIQFPFWIMALIFLINYALGKWGALKFVEYWQFRDVIKKQS